MYFILIGLSRSIQKDHTPDGNNIFAFMNLIRTIALLRLHANHRTFAWLEAFIVLSHFNLLHIQRNEIVWDLNKSPWGLFAYLSHDSEQISITVSKSKYLDTLVQYILLKNKKNPKSFDFHPHMFILNSKPFFVS